MLFPRTVDSIVANFNKGIRQLRALAESELVSAEQDADKAAELNRKVIDRRAVARRAYGIADKLQALIT